MPPRQSVRRWKWHTWVLVTAGAVWGAGQVLGRIDERPRWAEGLGEAWQDRLGIALSLGFWSFAGWWLWRNVRRGGRGPGRGPADLGRPYDMELELSYNGSRVPVRVVLAAPSASFEVSGPRARFGGIDPPLPSRVPLPDVRGFRVEPSRLHLDVATPGGLQTVTLIPRSYADRMRFVWEVAVVRPDLADEAVPATA